MKNEKTDDNRPILVQQGESLLFEADRGSARLTRLGWDTEGTGRAGINLLQAPVELRLIKDNRVLTPAVRVRTPDARTVQYDCAVSDGKQLTWAIAAHSGGMRMRVSCNAELSVEVDRLELVFPFDPRTAVTSVISSTWTEVGKFRLPAIISAPDLGQMLVKGPERPELTGRIEGRRWGGDPFITATFELPVPAPASAVNLEFSPVVLPMPVGFKDEQRWAAARRGWFNLIQTSCGATGGGRNVIGVWANNVLSDPVSCLLYMLGDATLLVPELAPGVTMAPILRRALDYWIDFKISEEGQVAYCANHKIRADDPETQKATDSMDANPGVLIGAWCYVKASGDIEWLKRRIAKLELISTFMENRDVDGDGLIESKQSGNSGSRPPRNPDCCWDCYMSGHKNAMSYRAWWGLADIEGRLGRHEQARHYGELADRLKGAFLSAFQNPETGWLGLWRSRDGKLHDLHMDAPTSFAIDCGVVDRDKGREMLDRYWRALQQTGFKRFDLGVPLNLRPVPREEMEHYTEFQQFLNGGCGVANTSYLLDALYIVGMTQEADMILEAMLKRQKDGVFPNGGGFQNGFVDKMGSGAEVFDWNGKPAGYEGHLVYCWAFLHSMLLREPCFRDDVHAGSKNKGRS